MWVHLFATVAGAIFSPSFLEYVSLVIIKDCKSLFKGCVCLSWHPCLIITVHHAKLVLRNSSHWLTLIDIWKQEDTWQCGFFFVFFFHLYNNLFSVNKKVCFCAERHVRDAVRCSTRQLPAAPPPLSLISFFLLVPLPSTTSPPADLESSVSLGRKRKVTNGSKSNSDVIECDLFCLSQSLVQCFFF